jgi:hypothetical protein
MAEDRGAFKTNPANSRQIPAIVMTRDRRCSGAFWPRKTCWRRPVTPPIFYQTLGSRCGILD